MHRRFSSKATTPGVLVPAAETFAFTRKEAHARSSGHPLIHSLEPGEIWSWCYVDDIAVEVPDVHGDAPRPIAFGG